MENRGRLLGNALPGRSIEHLIGLAQNPRTLTLIAEHPFHHRPHGLESELRHPVRVVPPELVEPEARTDDRGSATSERLERRNAETLVAGKIEHRVCEPVERSQTFLRCISQADDGVSDPELIDPPIEHLLSAQPIPPGQNQLQIRSIHSECRHELKHQAHAAPLEQGADKKQIRLFDSKPGDQIATGYGRCIFPPAGIYSERDHPNARSVDSVLRLDLIRDRSCVDDDPARHSRRTTRKQASSPTFPPPELLRQAFERKIVQRDYARARHPRRKAVAGRENDVDLEASQPRRHLELLPEHRPQASRPRVCDESWIVGQRRFRAFASEEKVPRPVELELSCRLEHTLEIGPDPGRLPPELTGDDTNPHRSFRPCRALLLQWIADLGCRCAVRCPEIMGKSLYATAAFLLHLLRDLVVTVVNRCRRYFRRVVLGEKIGVIGVDVEAFTSDATAEAVYAMRLVDAFARRDDNLVFNLYAETFPTQEPTHFEQIPTNNRVRCRIHRLPENALLPRRLTIGLLRIFFEPLVRVLDGNDVFFVPDLLSLGEREPFGRVTVATVHNVSFATMPASVAPDIRKDLRLSLPATLHRCDRVIAVSEAAADELSEHVELPRSRIHTIHQGLDPAFCQLADEDRPPGLELPSRYILFASVLEPRTNAVGVLRAFRLLVGWGYEGQLVLLGRWGWRSDEIRSELEASSVRDRIHHFECVDRADLPQIYRGADALVFPSWKEGFGRPLLEAMGCGTPVVTSGMSSMPEVAGPAAVYVDPSSPHSIASAVSSIVDDPLHRERLIRLGQERAARFSWDEAAAATSEVLRHAAGMAGGEPDEYRA